MRCKFSTATADILPADGISGSYRALDEANHCQSWRQSSCSSIFRSARTATGTDLDCHAARMSSALTGKFRLAEARKYYSAAHRDSRQSFARAAGGSHAGNCRGGNKKGSRSHARAARTHFQSRPRLAAGGKTGKYRRAGGDCEEFQMKNSTQRRKDTKTQSLDKFICSPLRLCVCAFALMLLTMKTLNVDLDLVQKIQRGRAALHQLSARDEIHRRGDVAEQLSEKISENNRVAARPLGLFSHSVLRNTVLVLRLHHGHHPESRARQGLC